MRRALLLLLFAAPGLILPLHASAAVDDEVIAACVDAGLGPEHSKMCRSWEQMTRLLALLCRQMATAECEAIDGRDPDAASDPWLAAALADQRSLGLDLALSSQLLLHTHNS